MLNLAVLPRGAGLNGEYVPATQLLRLSGSPVSSGVERVT
jgi:hypothetical protein